MPGRRLPAVTGSWLGASSLAGGSASGHWLVAQPAVTGWLGSSELVRGLGTEFKIESGKRMGSYDDEITVVKVTKVSDPVAYLTIDDGLTANEALNPTDRAEIKKWDPEKPIHGGDGAGRSNSVPSLSIASARQQLIPIKREHCRPTVAAIISAHDIANCRADIRMLKGQRSIPIKPPIFKREPAKSSAAVVSSASSGARTTSDFSCMGVSREHYFAHETADFPNYGAKWDDASDAFLLAQHRAGRSPASISAALGRTVNSIILRLEAHA